MKDYVTSKIQEIISTKDKVRDRMNELLSEREQLTAQYNALCGAEQAYNEMLSKLGEADKNEHN